MKKQELIQWLFMYRCDSEIVVNVGGTEMKINSIKKQNGKIVLSNAYGIDKSDEAIHNMENVLTQ